MTGVRSGLPASMDHAATVLCLCLLIAIVSVHHCESRSIRRHRRHSHQILRELTQEESSEVEFIELSAGRVYCDGEQISRSFNLWYRPSRVRRGDENKACEDSPRNVNGTNPTRFAPPECRLKERCTDLNENDEEFYPRYVRSGECNPTCDDKRKVLSYTCVPKTYDIKVLKLVCPKHSRFLRLHHNRKVRWIPLDGDLWEEVVKQVNIDCDCTSKD